MAQAPAPVEQPLRFEVASLKPHRANDDVMFGLQYGRGGLFTATGSLHMLMRTAYRLQEFQVVGGPTWMTSQLFDIVARTSAGTPPDTMRLMLQALLSERFGLRVRAEIRERPVYGLALAAEGFTSRPAFRPAAVHCEALRLAATTRGTTPNSAPSAARSCGIRHAPGHLTAAGMSMPALATNLSMWVDRVVVDRTGLRGTFDLDLRWMPDRAPATFFPLTPSDNPAQDAIDPTAPPLVTAIREQLGLKLDAQIGPVEVYVVEQAAPPTPD